MSTGYRAVMWNKYKKKYDLVLWAFIMVFITASILSQVFLFPKANFTTIIIRSFGLLSIFLLHIILSIGPLSRLNTRFLPLLYNRRHLGVSMFFVVSIHACLSIFWFHGNGNMNPLLSVFLSNTHYNSFLFFPFQTLGFAAYIILLLMAFTSHDFWLATLKPKVWKALHMLVYIAYILVVLHVILGTLQLENNPYTYFFILTGLIYLSVIHIWAGIISYKFDSRKAVIMNGWHYVCDIHDIENNKAKMVNLDDERIAIFRYDGKLSAVHNVCKHQNGPLGEGKIVDGCITCPWHGYQYRPADGKAPEPFTEKVNTYELKMEGTQIFVNPKPFAEGTYVTPLLCDRDEATKPATEFFIGWLGNLNKPMAVTLCRFIFPTALIGLLFMFSFNFLQKKIADAEYKYNEVATYTGRVSTNPFPHMLFQVTDETNGDLKNEVIPLINAWKFGADSLINKWLRKNYKGTATITGTIITRDGVKVLELSDEEHSFRLPATNVKDNQGNLIVLGNRKLSGEIVDPKCYLGAMNPGEGKPHRSCAIRCISGGIMPMLTYKEDDQIKYAVLLGVNGEKINNQVLDFIAEPIEVEGMMYAYENWNCFYINPGNIKRLKQ